MANKHDPIVYYVAKLGFTDVVKIGTTTNLGNRMARMRRTYGHDDLMILAFERGGEQTEKARHREFQSAHLLGEWFYFTDELRAHVKHLNDTKSYEVIS